MNLSELIEVVRLEKRTEERDRLTKQRDAILRDLRRGLREEEYVALAAELRPRVEGYAIIWKNREVIISRQGFMERAYTEAKLNGGRLSLSYSKRIKTGRDLLEFLAEVE